MDPATYRKAPLPLTAYALHDFFVVFVSGTGLNARFLRSEDKFPSTVSMSVTPPPPPPIAVCRTPPSPASRCVCHITLSQIKKTLSQPTSCHIVSSKPKVLRMASAMSDHLRSLRPALSLGPAAGGASWADRIVYSIGTFDRPRFSQGPNATAAAKAASLFTAAEANSTGSKNNSSSVSAAGSGGGGDSGGNKGGGSGSNNGGGWVDGLVTSPSSGHQLTGLPATSDDGQESASERMSSPLRFLREFGAVVVVGVFTSAAHAALHTAGNGGEKGAPPTDSLEARCARVHAHADRIVVIDSPHPARVRELLLGAAAGAAADVAAAACASGPNAVVSEGVEPHSSLLPGDTFDSRGHQQHHHHQQALEIGFGATTPPPPPSKNCCFVVCDWRRSGSRAVGDAGAEAGRRARRDIRAVMEANMPLFRLPRTTWECTSASSSDGEEEGEGSVLAF